MTTRRFNKLLRNLHNAKAFREIYDEYYPQLIKISIYLYGNKEDARDVAQEIFQYLLTHETKSYVLNPKAWFFALCKYNGQKLFKKELPLDEGIDCGIVFSEYISLEMQVALSKLQPEEARIVYLKWYCGFSLKEIADVMNKSYDAISKQHERIKKKLKDILSI